ncbi:MAG: ABC transporter substrate-binding protein [Actinomycetota bacterium]
MRIVPVDGDLAEIVFALGLGDRVVATDISATFPESADALPEIGYQRALSPEPILGFEPTIVLATDLAGPQETLDDLERLGVEVVVIERSSTSVGPGQKIRAVAEALGVPERGEALASTVDADIATESERARAPAERPRVGALYVRGDNVQLVLGQGGGVDWLIEAAGGIDIADDLGVVDNAPINAEALVVASPDVLIVPARGLESVGGMDGLLEVPGIAETPAGRNGRILVYDDQLLLGNGPRTGELLRQLITDLHGDIQ